MDSMAELIKAVEEGNKGVEAFTAQFGDRLDAMEAKADRPHLGGGGSPGAIKSDDPEVKSFNAYLKTGDRAELKAVTMTIGSGPDGGYAVPKVIDNAMETLLLPQSPIRQYATVQPVSTPDYHKLVNARGTTASWVGETQTRPQTDGSQLVDLNPPMGELYAYPLASQQMLEDVYFNPGQWIAQEAADAFGAAESDMFLNGNGVNRPKGILTYPTAATADATRAFGTLEYVPSGAASTLPLLTSTVNPLDPLFTLIYKMHPGYRGGAAWYMNSLTLSVVSAIKDYQGRYVVIPSAAIGQPATFLGYPIVECQHMADIGAGTYPIMFANLARGYIIVDRVGTSVLVDPFSSKPNVGYYVRKRVGGCVQNSRAVKLLKIATS
jgi:HK97 family phage major capsid protein